MSIAYFLLIIGLFGLIGYGGNSRFNYLFLLISIEILLLGTAWIIAIYSFSLDDIIGQIFILYILAIAAVEVAIGLSILVSMSRLRGSINVYDINLYHSFKSIPF